MNSVTQNSPKRIEIDTSCYRIWHEQHDCDSSVYIRMDVLCFERQMFGLIDVYAVTPAKFHRLELVVIDLSINDYRALVQHGQALWKSHLEEYKTKVEELNE